MRHGRLGEGHASGVIRAASILAGKGRLVLHSIREWSVAVDVRGERIGAGVEEEADDVDEPA